MIKKICGILVMSMIALSLYGCGGPRDVGSEGPKASDVASSELSIESEKSGFSLKVVKNSDLSVYITDVEKSEEGYSFDLAFENRTNKLVKVDFLKVAVDGVMCDPYFQTTIDPISKSTDKLTWSKKDLERVGVSDLGQVDFTLQAYQEGDDVNKIVNEKFTIYPQGKNKAKLVTRQDQETDQVIADNENAKVVVTAAAMVKDLGYVVKVYAENKTGFDARLSVSEAVVNDVTLRPEFLEDIPAKRAGYYTLYFGVDVLRVLNIEQIYSVILKTTMYNAKDINAAPLVQTDFNLKVK